MILNSLWAVWFTFVTLDVTVISGISVIAPTLLDWTFSTSPDSWLKLSLPAFWVSSLDVLWISWFSNSWTSDKVFVLFTSTFDVAIIGLVKSVTFASSLWTFIASGSKWNGLRLEALVVFGLDVSDSIAADLFVSFTILDGAWLANLFTAEFGSVTSTHLHWAVIAHVNEFWLLVLSVTVEISWFGSDHSVARSVNLGGSWTAWEFAIQWTSTFPVAAVGNISRVTFTSPFRASMTSLLGGRIVKAFRVMKLNVSESGTAVFWHGTNALFAWDTFSVATMFGPALIAETSHDWAISTGPLGWSGDGVPAFWIFGLQIGDSLVNWSWAIQFWSNVLWTRADPITTISNILDVTAAGLEWAVGASSFQWRNGGSEAFWILEPDMIVFSASSIFSDSLWTCLDSAWFTNLFATGFILEASTFLFWALAASFFSWESYTAPALWVGNHGSFTAAGRFDFSWAFSFLITVSTETFPVTAFIGQSGVAAADLLWTDIVATNRWVHSFSVTFWVSLLGESISIALLFFNSGANFAFLVATELDPRFITETSLLWTDVASPLSWLDSFIPTLWEVFL